jgi:hypothetical protein
LLFEAYLLQRVSQDSLSRVGSMAPQALAQACYDEISRNASLRRQMISVGIPILTPQGDRLLRGPVIKVDDAEAGWVDLGVANMRRWQERLSRIHTMAQTELDQDADLLSSRFNHVFVDTATQKVRDTFNLGELVAWIFIYEEGGARRRS